MFSERCFDFPIHIYNQERICEILRSGAMDRVACVSFPKTALFGIPPVQLGTRAPLASCSIPLKLGSPIVKPQKWYLAGPLAIEAKADSRTESARIRNRRTRKKFTGTASKPRLSVFCSDKQLYAMLVDDQNKKCFFYGSTLQKSIRGDPPCSTVEGAKRVGEDLIKVCMDLNINEISSYDRNGSAHGERMEAFEIAISRHGFLPR